MEKNRKTYIFNPGDRIDIGTVDSLRQDIDKVIKEKQVNEIHIDMKFVQVCDMYGVNFLVDSCKIIKDAGLEYSISKPLPLIREILMKSGFDNFQEMTKEESN